MSYVYGEIKRDRTITNAQGVPSAGDITQSPARSPLMVPIEDHSDKDYSVSVNISQLKIEPKSQEEKETDKFLDAKFKESISNQIRDRNREKKLPAQDSKISYDTKSVSNGNTQKQILPKPYGTKSVSNGNTQKQILPKPIRNDPNDGYHSDGHIELDKKQIVNLKTAFSIEKDDQTKKTLPETEVSTTTTPSIQLSHTSNSENEISEVNSLLETEISIPTESIPLDSSQENNQDESKARNSASSKLPEAEDSSLETQVRVPQVNVSLTPSKLRSPISILPKDPEEKQKHVIKIVLERFPYLTLKHSFKYSNYFDFNRSVLCPLCNKNHKKENIRNYIEGEWGSGEYCGEKTYRLYCYINKYQNSIQIVTVKA
ncbi:18850_t:CDS:2 [Gigaspora margarita]|uniref:18850_t:CDS:1 n=1 Tax=Gigaspora margarita TaxID=4874 RepID=A0ABN7VB18_GIGMA|nr:18850_t:CDS:2 [Gigaspora margarita]